ncbi:unnamed protein product [Closterium sp. Yama58-4]|nr:unnamed protein product [Closterium sp. Yama58-4]
MPPRSPLKIAAGGGRREIILIKEPKKSKRQRAASVGGGGAGSGAAGAAVCAQGQAVVSGGAHAGEPQQKEQEELKKQEGHDGETQKRQEEEKRREEQEKQKEEQEVKQDEQGGLMQQSRTSAVAQQQQQEQVRSQAQGKGFMIGEYTRLKRPSSSGGTGGCGAGGDGSGSIYSEGSTPSSPKGTFTKAGGLSLPRTGFTDASFNASVSGAWQQFSRSLRLLSPLDLCGAPPQPLRGGRAGVRFSALEGFRGLAGGAVGGGGGGGSEVEMEWRERLLERRKEGGFKRSSSLSEAEAFQQLGLYGLDEEGYGGQDGAGKERGWSASEGMRKGGVGGTGIGLGLGLGVGRSSSSKSAEESASAGAAMAASPASASAVAGAGGASSGGFSAVGFGAGGDVLGFLSRGFGGSSRAAGGAVGAGGRVQQQQGSGGAGLAACIGGAAGSAGRMGGGARNDDDDDESLLLGYTRIDVDGVSVGESERGGVDEEEGVGGALGVGVGVGAGRAGMGAAGAMAANSVDVSGGHLGGYAYACQAPIVSLADRPSGSVSLPISPASSSKFRSGFLHLSPFLSPPFPPLCRAYSHVWCCPASSRRLTPSPQLGYGTIGCVCSSLC